MIVKFHNHGTGGARGALNYLLKEKAEKGSDRRLPLKPRAHARILSGDPVVTEQLIDTTPYKQKYKSGVLSFEKRANELTEQQKFEIMQKFEDTIFCGLERDQFDILWIEHADKDIDKEHPVGRLELNFLIAGQELRSGKRLQPFYAGADMVRVNAFKDIVNYEYKLADPNAPDRERVINPYVSGSAPPTPYDMTNYSRQSAKKDAEVIANPPNRTKLRDAINRRMELELKQGMIRNRQNVLFLLKSWGLRIERSNSEDSISVSSDHLKDKNGESINVRLKGGVYKKEFDGVKMQPHLIELRKKAYYSLLPSRYEKMKETLAKGIEIKKKYHSEIYKDVELPEPLQLNVIDVSLDQLETQASVEPTRLQSDYSSPSMDY